MQNEITHPLLAFIRSIPTAPANEITLSEQIERGQRRLFEFHHGFTLLEANHMNARQFGDETTDATTWTP